MKRNLGVNLSLLVTTTVLIAINSINVSGVELIAYISQHGLHGEIMFRQIETTNTTIEIRTKLGATLQYPDQAWSWGVHRYPVDYTETDPSSRCNLENVGPEVMSFNEDLGFLILPGNESSVWMHQIQLTGENGIWGKSLVLTDAFGGTRICATITTVQLSLEHMAEARFKTPIAGSVYFRWLATTANDSGDTLIYSNLYHIQSQPMNEREPEKPMTLHHWKIFVTDILENDRHRTEENCNFLHLVFDPQGYGEGHGLGDLDNRLGKLRVAKNALRKQEKAMFRDAKLALLPSDLTIPHRTLYLVLFDSVHSNNFIACTKIRHLTPLLYKAFISSKGIKGEITFAQRSKFDPTFLNFTFVSSGRNSHHVNRKFAEDVSAFQIHSLPPMPSKLGDLDYCHSTGSIYNPRGLESDSIPPPGFGTQDQYAVGDLSGKLQGRNPDYFHNYLLPGSSAELSGIYWDTFLPLQGINSVAHRGMVLHTYDRKDAHNITSNPWACATITQFQKNGIYQKTIRTAQVLFRYPLVGRVILRQPADEPWQDTTVIFEYLIHADGSTQNTSFSHRWAIHSTAPGKDFYDWQNRCISAGDVFNPHKADWGKKPIDDFCDPRFPAMCRVGALGPRMGALTIAGRKSDAPKLSRLIFTDSNLPLSGRHNVMGKSLVIYDDFGPKARGERLACSVILGHYRRKVVAKDWHPNGAELTVSGKLEIIQQSEYDRTNLEINLKGLVENSGYHIHMTPVEGNLAFPCENSSLYEHWNPFRINRKLSPPPTQGTTDQYEMGDLSGKFGTLDHLTQYENTFNDSSLPLFGYNSIIGRSVVIHKKQRNARWACTTLERGYSPNEAREIRAIASFHNPSGYAYGYVKMSQLIYNDGGQSETLIEVNLRYPGVNDRNTSRNHDWKIFVNPVSVDATVKQTITRCVAGGYVWNPFYTQLADPLNQELYEQECGPDNPLRCYVGDVGIRLGTINLGEGRAVYTDSNFPLETPVGAIGRSLVIFGPERSNERFACANIEPDHNIVKYLNLQKPPRFVITQFLEELRSVMGIPEWMLDIDARKTKELHNGGCIQMIIHFRGPIAHRLELDMSRLIAAGRLDAPSLFIPGWTNPKRKAVLSYRTCGVRDSSEEKSRVITGRWSKSSYTKPKIFIVLTSIFISHYVRTKFKKLLSL